MRKAFWNSCCDWRRGLAALLASLALTVSASAVNVVTNASEAALDAALRQGGDIILAFDGTLTVTTQKVISANTVLNGTGHSIRLSGGNRSRLFTVNTRASLTLSNLALINGQTPGKGGAIYNSGQLVLAGCTFSNNAAVARPGATGAKGSSGGILGVNGGAGGSGNNARGGAIFNLGSAIIDRCTFVTNRAVGGAGGSGGAGGRGGYSGGQGGDGGTGGNAMGGAIFSRGVLQMSGTLFQSNSVSGGAGGLGGTNGGGQFPLSNGNGGVGGWAGGGAVCAVGNSSFSSVIFLGNNARGGAAADAPTNSPANIGATGSNGGDGYGGSLYTGGTNTLANCRFWTNNAAGGKGGNGGNGSPWGGNGGQGGSAWGGHWYNSGINLGKSYGTNCAFAAGQCVPGAGGAAGSGPLPGRTGAAGTRHGDKTANVGAALVLTNSAAQLTLNIGPGGAVSISGSGGEPGQAARLLVSTDLIRWTAIATNRVSADGSVSFSGTEAGPRQFYRVEMP